MPRRTLNQIKKLDRNQTNLSKGSNISSDQPCCGLCGKTKKLTQTKCCNHWICDDESQYQLFSYARNSCYRNHRRYTLCGAHHAEEHAGRWQDCQECRNRLDTEMYVYFGTNEYNFEKLKNPPKYEPTHCTECDRVIRLGTDAYSYYKGGYLCEKCSDRQLGKLPELR